MEAITRVPADASDQDDTVAMVMQKGYALKGTLIRPARVAVYKQG
jgi:molecular chaperone GrpE (heat shock protein)